MTFLLCSFCLGYYCNLRAATPTPTDGTTGNICPQGKFCPEQSPVQGIDCPIGILTSVHVLRYFLGNNRSSRPEVFCKKGVCRNFAKFTGKHLYQSLIFNKVAIKTLAQVFSYEVCEISKNTFFHRTPLVAASEIIVFSDLSSLHLLVQSQQCKLEKKVYNMFKVNNKNTRTTSLTLFCCFYC